MVGNNDNPAYRLTPQAFEITGGAHGHATDFQPAAIFND
jgi:hypothetical protein